MSLNVAELTLFQKGFKELLPLKIEKLYIPNENILVLTLYKSGFKKHLLIEVGNNDSGLYLTKERPEQRLVANIQNRFRTLLLNAVIYDIEQLNHDRILKLKTKHKEKEVTILLELTGRHGNIFLLQNHKIEAILLLNKKDKQREIHLYHDYVPPLSQNKKNYTILNQSPEDFLNYLEHEYAEKIQKQKQERKQEQALSHVLRQIKKLHKKQNNLKRDLKKLESYQEYKKFGELLKANIYQMQRGMTSIDVIDYYDPDMPNIHIPLEASKTPAENMERYFKKYDKYHRGIQHIEQEFKKITAKLEQLEQEKETPSLLETTPKLQNKKNRTQERMPYKTYISSSGFRILVGRGSLDNDTLTFKVASGNDLWLHVISYSGSHVVIKRNNKKDVIDKQSIYEAAHLAIQHSKAPKNDAVEVCYTFKKFVKKPPKSKPGAVIYTQEKRLYLALDSQVIQKLQTK